MKTNDLLLSCYFEQDHDQWLGFCLDFSLVAQAESLQEVTAKLEEQMKEYVHDATVGADRQHAGYLLRRRAPLNYWVKFYVTLVRQELRHTLQASKHRKSVREAMPLAPVCA